MKKQFISSVLFTFLSFGLLLSSCSTDNSVITPATANAPTASFVSGTGIVSSDASLTVGTEFTVELTSAKGDNPLKVLTIQEAGANVDLSRIKINGVAASSNPILLYTTDKTSFDYKITIKSSSDIATKTFDFIIGDDASNKTTKSLAITTIGTPPTIELKTADSLGIAPNSLFGTTFRVTKGSAALKTVEIQENGVKITDLSRLYYDKLTAPFTANPQTIATADKDLFSRDIIINSPTSAGKYVYSFIFTDEAGLTKTQKVTLVVGTSVEVITGALLNAAGPDGTGGLDLDTGKGTGSTAAAAEIRDQGVDSSQPSATNWKQQISGVNGSVIRYVVAGTNGVSSSFSFANVSSKEEIADLFTKGVAFTGTTSNKIVKGDILVVQNGTKYYLLSIKTVTVTTTDNNDQYTIDIKK